MTGETTIRVRYAETDRMGLLHHANYLIYFEQARTELLRDQGLTYREMEDQGFFLVIAKVEVNFKSDYLPRDKMATPGMIAAIQGNSTPVDPNVIPSARNAPAASTTTPTAASATPAA